jgi:hypothetical protein
VKVRSVLAAVIVSTGVLAACGASAPPADELAIEVIDSLDVSESVKECMRAEVDKFDEDELDQIAAAADDGDAEGLAGIAAFQAALEDCQVSG